MRWWWRGFGCHEVWLVVSLGFDLTAGVGVGFDLVAGVGDRFGCGLLGWVWEGMAFFLNPHAVLPFSLCLSVSHSLSLSRSHLRLLTVSPPASWSLTLTLAVSHLTVSLPARSHLRDSRSRSFTVSP
uniref:Uncharacterized protein n=1 Tax=Fagus sylvatica TaxID=28930 RepID=A0A2N9I0J4_FAGSY